jgi:hypothetical protein
VIQARRRSGRFRRPGPAQQQPGQGIALARLTDDVAARLPSDDQNALLKLTKNCRPYCS